MGYKTNWTECNRNELEEYFRTVHKVNVSFFQYYVHILLDTLFLKALDMHLAVVILRVSKGLDYSDLLGEELPYSIYEIPKNLPSNDSSAELKVAHSTIHGSCDSLNHNVSQGNLKFQFIKKKI